MPALQYATSGARRGPGREWRLPLPKGGTPYAHSHPQRSHEGSRDICHARRVLVVDDTPVLRQLLELTLTAEGYAVHTASHGRHALKLLANIAPCLILLDLRMPVMDGHAFARAYRARTDADAHIIVMTAEARAGELEAIAPVHVIPKPFDLDQLLPIVEQWVQAHPSRPA